MNLFLSFFNSVSSADISGVAEETSPLTGIVTILVAVIVAFLAIKILKHTAKTMFIIAVVVSAILLLTGVIDFAMIKSAGYSIWDWLLKTDLYHEVTNGISNKIG